MACFKNLSAKPLDYLKKYIYKQTSLKIIQNAIMLNTIINDMKKPIRVDLLEKLQEKLSFFVLFCFLWW